MCVMLQHHDRLIHDSLHLPKAPRATVRCPENGILKSPQKLACVPHARSVCLHGEAPSWCQGNMYRAPRSTSACGALQHVEAGASLWLPAAALDVALLHSLSSLQPACTGVSVDCVCFLCACG
jgi:hypothetical protein